MGAACARPSVAASPQASAHSHGLAESKDAQGPAANLTPRNIDLPIKVTPRAGWTTEEDDGTTLMHRRSLDLRKSVEQSGRSIARCDTLTREHESPEEALQELLNGNMRFMIGETDHPHQDFKRLQTIAPKQKPIAAVLACADSRVPVELLFDQGFGDIFVCRIAGNIATPEEIASLEYAVIELGVKVIMVMGHTSCGAVKAALSGKAFPGFIDTLVDHLDVAVVRAQGRNAKSYEELNACKCPGSSHPDASMIEQVIRENVLYQIDRCRRSTLILEAMKRGKLILVPTVYDIKTGQVEVIS